ncbi:MAG TPA: class III signal peptide-containing protein [Candidatus Nanopusillus sp.]|nr:class III signal peptide-containing protein [Candidatus Nanopusillus sp.]
MRGQISLEFSILFFSLLVVVIITTITPGLYGYKKTIETSSASLGHGAMSKLKNNIEMLSVLDPGSAKIVYIKSPPGIWRINGSNITLEGNGFNISTKCSVILMSNVSEYRTNLSVIEIRLEKRNNNTIHMKWGE